MSQTRTETSHRLWWLMIGWLTAGTLDILYAIGFSYARSGIAPSRILQSVAAGRLDRPHTRVVPAWRWPASGSTS